MNVLSDVLRVVRLTGAVFLDARFTAPWSLVTNDQPEKMKLFLAPATQIIGFHYIVSGGDAWRRLDSGKFCVRRATLGQWRLRRRYHYRKAVGAYRPGTIMP